MLQENEAKFKGEAGDSGAPVYILKHRSSPILIGIIKGGAQYDPSLTNHTTYINTLINPYFAEIYTAATKTN